MKKSCMNRLLAALLLASAVGILLPVRAQTVSTEQKTLQVEAAATGDVRDLTFWTLIKQGGWTMWPLGLLSVGTLFFIIRNGLMLRQKGLLRSDLRPKIEELLAVGNVADVRRVCAENTSLMTTVLDAGLERVSEQDVDMEHVKEAIEEAGNEQMVTYMKPINYLSIIGGVAPMLGLLGTVSGMIKAFQAISAGGMGKPELLAGHIGEALITTATGLTIAIPAMIAYFIFKNNFIKHMSAMERMIGHFLNVYRNAQNR
ncbi:MAG: MotA/TolQ/ExbB proton channel family protein [Kiritimatiellales bacterium]